MTGATQAPRPKGRLLVVSGPSGVGKSAVVARLLRDPRFARAITATTRPARPAEVDGVDYIFLTEAEFLRREAAGSFLENARVYGHRYGTPRESVETVRSSGRHCVLVIDVQGAMTLRGMRIDAEYVFLQPPSAEELVRRLLTRGGDSTKSVERRLLDARKEMLEGSTWPHELVNRDIDECAREIAAVAGVALD